MTVSQLLAQIPETPQFLARSLRWSQIEAYRDEHGVSIDRFLEKCTHLDVVKFSQSVNDRLFQRIVQEWMVHFPAIALKKAQVINVILSDLPSLRECTLAKCRSLVTIELQNCHALRLLNIEDLPALKTVKVIHCTQLVQLILKKKLTSLIATEISTCSSLIYLTVEAPLLTTFSIMNLSALKFLEVVNCAALTSLECQGKGLTSLRELTIKGCTALEEAKVDDLSSLKRLITLNSHPQLSLSARSGFRGSPSNTPHSSPKISPKENETL